MLKKTRHSVYMFGGTAVGGLLFLSYYTIPSMLPIVYDSDTLVASVGTEAVTSEPLREPPVIHVQTPAAVKAVYMSQCVAGTPSFRDSLVKLIATTELNAVIIDIKDYTGYISFPTENADLSGAVSQKCGARDMKDFVKSLHEKGVYVIGRVTVFQDPRYTGLYPEQSVQSKSRPGEPWKDFKGLSFVSVNSRPFWEYIVELSKESYAIGFDELNYDYIRWPSDGPMSDIVYQTRKPEEDLEKFFMYLRDAVKPTGAVMSADLFGMTTTNFDDLNIGQVLERALPHFDFVAPMVYPSHYPKSFLGLGNPNSDPYRVVNYAMVEAVKRAIATTTPMETLTNKPIASTTPQLYAKQPDNHLKLRPWLQDFDYGGTYDIAEVRAQIKATYDAGLTSWMLWDPGNKYTPEALQPE